MSRLTYELTILKEKVTASIDWADQNCAVPLEYAGSEEKIAILKDFLRDCFGAYGHVFNPDTTTSADLMVAIRNKNLSGFFPKLIEGEEPAVLSPGIPEDCQT
jgi:hypothetical protein